MTRKSNCAMFTVALALGMVAAISESEASRRICEEWRDYYYNTQTGEFIEWAGPPYWECWYMDEPVSRPRGNPYGDYGGGWGIPRNPQYPTCEHCQTLHEACTNRIERGTQRCMDHFEALSRRWCSRYRRTMNGLPIGGDYECTEVEDGPGPPVEYCVGPAIDECVEDFARDHPERTAEDTREINVGHDWFGLGAGATSTVRWGGTYGYISGCLQGRQEAGVICLARQNACEERAGGCQ